MSSKLHQNTLVRLCQTTSKTLGRLCQTTSKSLGRLCQITLKHPRQTMPSATYIPQNGTVHHITSLGNPSSAASPHSFCQCEELVCDTCSTCGHSATKNSSLAKSSPLQQHIKTQPDQTGYTATSWKSIQSSHHFCAVAYHFWYLLPAGCPSTPTLAISDIYEVYFL